MKKLLTQPLFIFITPVVILTILNVICALNGIYMDLISTTISLYIYAFFIIELFLVIKNGFTFQKAKQNYIALIISVFTYFIFRLINILFGIGLFDRIIPTVNY